jgi:hypothetical protein
MSSGVLMSRDGPPCERCKVPMVIYEHRIITEHMLRQAHYHFRWYRCANHDCTVTEVYLDEFKVVNAPQRTWMDQLADNGVLPI